MADGIGRDHISDHVENDLRNHNSLLNISTNLTELMPALAVVFKQAIENGLQSLIVENGYQYIRRMINKGILTIDLSRYCQVLIELMEYCWANKSVSHMDDTIIWLTETWRAELDSRRIVGILSLDVSKAFDSHSPQLVISKLQANKSSDKALQLIRLYFQGRENRIGVGSVTSDWVVMKRGIVHREELVWNIFQNDTPNVMSGDNGDGFSFVCYKT